MPSVKRSDSRRTAMLQGFKLAGCLRDAGRASMVDRRGLNTVRECQGVNERAACYLVKT